MTSRRIIHLYCCFMQYVHFIREIEVSVLSKNIRLLSHSFYVINIRRLLSKNLQVAASIPRPRPAHRPRTRFHRIPLTTVLTANKSTLISKQKVLIIVNLPQNFHLNFN